MYEELKTKEYYDVLTQTYNREYFFEKAQEILSEKNESCMLAIIDLDNFKSINRLHGQTLGNMLLCEIAGKLKRFLGNNEISGRLGGDEFIMLLRGFKNSEEAKVRLKALENFLESDNSSIKTSACIGAALFPEHGNSFDDILLCADVALDYSKRFGYGTGTLFEKSLKLPVAKNRVKTSIWSEIKQDFLKSFDENFVEYILDILYNSPQPDLAIPSILSYIGNRFDVSRAYIIELSEDGETYCNTFEWTAEGVLPRISTMRELPAKYLEYEGISYQSYFSNGNTFICNDISELTPTIREILITQSIKASAQFALLSDGEFAGVIGYDDCRNKREWSGEEIEALMYASRVLGMFYMNYQNSEKLKNSRQLIVSLIDNIPAASYVLNPETYEIIMVNKTIKSLFPYAKIGDKCYQAFRDHDSVCDNCPAAECIKTGAVVQNEIYNEVLDSWNQCTASKLKWQADFSDREVCLLTCFDITKYKKREALDLGDTVN